MRIAMGAHPLSFVRRLLHGLSDTRQRSFETAGLASLLRMKL